MRLAPRAMTDGRGSNLAAAALPWQTHLDRSTPSMASQTAGMAADDRLQGNIELLTECLVVQAKGADEPRC